MSTQVRRDADPDHFILEDVPQSIQQTMLERAAWLKTLPRRSTGEEYLVSDAQTWTPGQRVRVAFLGGTPELHKSIADATTEITSACNLTLDFGFDTASGQYRSWSTTDTEYKAEIRVSFDLPGYWSLIGTDSIDSAIGQPEEPSGGRPNQRTLNLSRFHLHKPADWKGTTRHEFMHAIAFRHEHQNLRGPCQEEFRWEDDPGYVRTTDSQGTFITDDQGRRPGIYTYLSGPPNNWSKAKVDHNLRAHGDESDTAGQFDRASIMLYRFPALFYRTTNSPCAPTSDGERLSDGDKEALGMLYPQPPELVMRELNLRTEFLNALESQLRPAFPGLEFEERPASRTFAAAAALALRVTL